MLEAVIAAAVLGILASIVLPKLSYMLDVIYVDYEIRRLHSTLHYTKSVCRIANYERFRLGQQSGYVGKALELQIQNSETPIYYRLKRQSYSEYLGDKHYFERDFSLRLKNNIGRAPINIGFDVYGDFSSSDNTKEGTLVLSKGKVQRTVVLQGYGRMRIDRQ